MKYRTPMLAVLGLALSASVAWAVVTVTFDPTTGTGFVGKGDVQLAYGWNNATLQANANSLAFSFTEQTVYSVTCEWWTGPTNNRRRHEVTIPRTRSVNAVVEYMPRSRNQVNGFNLFGFSAVAVSGPSVPAVGGTCPGASNQGLVIEVEDLGTSGSELVVTNAGGAAAVIWSTQ